MTCIIFPGSHHNPAWDQSEETNVHFITAAFGMHLIINITFMMTSYTVMVFYRKLKMKAGSSLNTNITWKYSMLNNEDDLQCSDNDLQYKDDKV